MLGSKKLRETPLETFAPFALVIACIAFARFVNSEFLVLGGFLVALFVCVWREYDSRIFVGTALFLLIICAGLLVTGDETYANEVATYVYYFLVIGVVGLFIDYLRYGSKS